MNILITGMQRSGTTLLRRIFTIHPQVRHIFHESFFLSKFKTSKLLNAHMKSIDINPKQKRWGEKCPYYPNIRRIRPEEYCETLHEWYPKKFRVVHIIRHPIDIAKSNVEKFKYIKSVHAPLRMYKSIVPRIINNFEKLPYIIQIKYEDLLLNPDIVIPEIYEFCNLKSDINFRKKLKKLKNPIYQQLNSDRAFAYKQGKQGIKLEFSDVFEVTNKIKGPKYK